MSWWGRRLSNPAECVDVGSRVLTIHTSARSVGQFSGNPAKGCISEGVASERPCRSPPPSAWLACFMCCPGAWRASSVSSAEIRVPRKAAPMRRHVSPS